MSIAGNRGCSRPECTPLLRWHVQAHAESAIDLPYAPGGSTELTGGELTGGCMAVALYCLYI